MLEVMPGFRFFNRMALRKIQVSLCHGHQSLIVLVKSSDLVFAEIFNVNQAIAGAAHGRNNFVKFQMNRQCVFILGALDQKDHQKGDDCCARVNHELPRIRKFEDRSGECPDENDCQCQDKRGGCTRRLSCAE